MSNIYEEPSANEDSINWGAIRDILAKERGIVKEITIDADYLERLERRWECEELLEQEA